MFQYNLKSTTDEQLIELIRDYDSREAFDELYNRHWKYLFTSSFNLLRDRDESMDICQVVFLWFWEHRKTINIKTNIRGYLYSSVKYKIANFIRSGKIRESFFDELKRVDIDTFQENEMEVKELQIMIFHLVNDLPKKCKEVFQLSRNENLTHKQIADKLGISEKTVDDHILRALKKLRTPLNRLASIFIML
ncbi:RNA polymerase sigma-70 factor [Pedobacter sp. ASV1-7]|uniref:RNA polymerase sigma-70 factor n=1 Tax=Pedobacter sp. ASV1-7 TaxID=3145237 RepID=UPI0032E93265